MKTDLLIIGAGPFGLATAREASRRGIDHHIVGRPMALWRDNMPAGMCLRSGVSWHLDPAEELTMDAFVADRGLDREALLPLSIARYLEYAAWFQERAGIEVDGRMVTRLRRDGDAGFAAELASGQPIEARRVVAAVGFHAFDHRPGEVVRLFPAGRCQHTRDFVDLEAVRNRRVLIIGGRQSAFEWAALMCDEGAAAVHVVHRHPSPAFARSDWSWVPDLVGRLEQDPGWFAALPDGRRAEIEKRFWEQGRLKVEPWLEPRIDREIVSIWPGNKVRASTHAADDTLEVELASGDRLAIDDVVLATGYRVDLGRLGWLDRRLRESIATRDGFPVLDRAMQSSVPGLHFTSMAATRQFGPFMAFTVSVAPMTRVLGRGLAEALDA